MNTFANAAFAYTEAYRKRVRIEKELRTLEDEQLERKKELTLEFEFAKREEAKLLIKLDESTCPESIRGHSFPTDCTSDKSGLKICTKCGFEKKE
jgi:hypothetical protein